MVEQELGERNFGFDSLMSRLNCDTGGEKGLNSRSWAGGVLAPAGELSGSLAAPPDSLPVTSWQTDELDIYFCMESPCFFRWSTKSYICFDWRGMEKWVVIFKCACFPRRRGRQNWLARLVTLGGVLSEMHISLKKACTDIFQSLYVCGSTRDQKQHPKSQEKCCFHNSLFI